MNSRCVIWRGELRRGYGPYREVWRREHGATPRGFHVHHRCRDRRCVNLEHLELLPAREHFILTFLEDRGRSIEDVHTIRRLGRAGVGARELAARFELGRRTVDGILNGEVWAPETGGERIVPDRPCAWCGAPIVGRYRNAIYCSSRHRKQAAEKIRRDRRYSSATGEKRRDIRP